MKKRLKRIFICYWLGCKNWNTKETCSWCGGFFHLRYGSISAWNYKVIFGWVELISRKGKFKSWSEPYGRWA